MKRKRTFSDFMYDNNDIFVAFIIIVVALSVIGWCVRNVMNYPNTLDSVTTAEKVQSAVEQESKSTDPGASQAQWKNGKLAKTITIDVADDSTEAAINSLIAAGLFRTADQFRAICKKAGVSDADIKTGALRVDGGASANNFLMQFQANLMNADVIRPQVIETTAMGAAMLAGRAVGLWTDTDLKSLQSVDREFTPDMDERQRAALLRHWHRAVERSRGWAEANGE